MGDSIQQKNAPPSLCVSRKRLCFQRIPSVIDPISMDIHAKRMATFIAHVCVVLSDGIYQYTDQQSLPVSRHDFHRRRRSCHSFSERLCRLTRIRAFHALLRLRSASHDTRSAFQLCHWRICHFGHAFCICVVSKSCFAPSSRLFRYHCQSPYLSYLR